MASTAKNSPCPVCDDAAAPRADNKFFPFCSERCRVIDLGRWLDERYRIPAEDTSDEPGDPSAPGGPPDDQS